MPKSYQIRLTAVVLALLTIGVCALAAFNFSAENNFDQPTDGAWWIESTSQQGLEARRVPADTPAARAGIKTGDILVAIDDLPTPRLAPLMREVYHDGIYARATYTLLRTDPALQTPVKLDTQVILEPRDLSINLVFRLIALVYLCIGLYVLFRRWTAPKSTHFYLFCVFSFVLCAFRYTGEFNELDWIIFWSNIVAQALQPALLLHFAATFTDETSQRMLWRKRILIALIYIPGICLVGLQAMAVYFWSATETLQHRLNQIDLGYLALYYVITACIFFSSYRHTESPLRRQQLKWLTRGTVLAVTPFTLFYVIPYLADGAMPDLLNKFSVGMLVFLPLTFSYAIVRYRLMDVDLIFKRGVTYTLTTAAVVGLYFGLVAGLAESVHTRLPWTGKWGLLAAIVITAQLFDPIKRAIQARVDRIFEQKRYDYRETLIQFGRGITSQTDLHALIVSIVNRLTQTLLVGRIAVFVAQDGDGRPARFTLEGAHGIPEKALQDLAQQDTNLLDLGFLDFDHRSANSHIFLENPQQALRLPDAQRNAARLLDLNYYLPCRVQDRETQRTIAVIGLGRTTGGDFLSSEDMELLESLASYIGIAIQNARLYSTLEKKIAEFERLKEFNENIVESINIGIFAVDLDDCIESWNAQMEVMYALPRAEALRQPLAAVFPSEFLDEYNRVKDTPGVHNLYKFRLITRSGEARIANIAIAPLVTRDFAIVGRILLMEDITGRIELEGQLAQAEKLSSIGLLAAGVAHEVNTPLAVISSYAQMLGKQVRGNEEIAPMLEKITQQTFRASEIVNGLLNFSRTSSTEFTRVDLNQIIRDTLTLLEHQFKSAQIKVETALAELPTVNGNQGKLQQVLLNLFLNAKDAIIGNSANTQPGGTLRVTTMLSGDSVKLIIADTGSGISPENMLRIYDPFFTTKGTPRDGQSKGTGLGLAVTYGIIQEHSGKIAVESNVGEGTSFHLEFPTLRDAGASPEAPTGNRSTTHA
ncbi:MAG TPA: ATP-binding protein [Acidobacteriaceae bacterium]|nr:ATP-binding protein [Acidobacteriaceae bacterium]